MRKSPINRSIPLAGMSRQLSLESILFRRQRCEPSLDTAFSESSASKRHVLSTHILETIHPDHSRMTRIREFQASLGIIEPTIAWRLCFCYPIYLLVQLSKCHANNTSLWRTIYPNAYATQHRVLAHNLPDHSPRRLKEYHIPSLPARLSEMVVSAALSTFPPLVPR